MGTYTWFGGTGLFSTPGDWDPHSVPGAADLGVVDSGAVVLVGQQVGATVELAGTMPGTDPILVLANASIRAVTMPAILPAQPYNQLAAPSYYGAIAVRDHASIGTIALGAYANLDRAPPPYGHGPLTAPDSLTVNLAPGAQLAAGFDVQWGSTLVVDGSGHSAFHATSGTLEGGNATIAAALLGPGTITLTHGPTDYTGYASVGTLDLGRVVGPGETIDISMGILQIDRPLEFHGTIDIAPSENPAGGGSGYQSYGPQMVTLEGLTATSYNFDDCTHVLSLYQGDSVVDRVAFTPDVIGASFGSGYDHAIGVAQSSQGVVLRGQYASYPADATELPLHVASA